MGPITKHIPLSIYLWKAMRQKTFDKAMDILGNASRGIGYYHLANRFGNMAGIENIYDDYTVLKPEKTVRHRPNK